MSKSESFLLGRDRKGVLWDVLMYIPTVGGLAGVSAMFWYDGNKGLAYLLFFLACFFFYQGLHRILQRLVLLPSSPVRVSSWSRICAIFRIMRVSPLPCPGWI